MVFGIGARNPEKFEQRAVMYEQKGKVKKAQKNREKAAKIRSGGKYTGPAAAPVASSVGPTGGTSIYSGNAATGPSTVGPAAGLGFSQLGNIAPHLQPQGVAGHPPIVSVFQNAPVAGGLATKSAAPLGATSVTAPATITTTSTTTAMPLPIQQNTSTYIQPGQQGQLFNYNSQRTPADYEARALKWENRGNWQKAQKNREKVWRAQNPGLLSQQQAPQFYNNGKFMGYQQSPLQQTTTTTMPLV